MRLESIIEVNAEVFDTTAQLLFFALLFSQYFSILFFSYAIWKTLNSSKKANFF